MSALKALAGSVSHLRARIGDPERAGVAVVLAGGTAAVVTLLIGGYVSLSGSIFSVLHLLAVLLPVVGGILVLVSAGWGLRRRLNYGTVDPLVDGDPPERGSIRSIRDIQADDPIEASATDRYRCQHDDRTREVRQRLLDGAVRTLVARGGHGRAAARDAIQTGEWTDDRVAAAFLSPAVSQPLAEQLRRMVDPGAAYTHRVRRTLAAIETIGTETPADAAQTAGTAETDESPAMASVQEGPR